MLAAFTLATALLGASTLLIALSKPGFTSAKFLNQQISWQECNEKVLPKLYKPDSSSGYELSCATVLVPADYKHPDNSPTFTIQLIKHHNIKNLEPKGSIFLNPGGPGASGVEQVLWSQFSTTLTKHFDFISFDPRGVGFSQLSDGKPFSCDDEDFWVANVAGHNFATNISEERAIANTKNSYYSNCAKANPLWHTLRTTNVAKDLEVLRKVVTGDQKLKFIGTSYGTMLAAEYLKQFPENVGQLVFDGPVGLSEDQVESSTQEADQDEVFINSLLSAYAKSEGISVEVAWQRVLESKRLAREGKIKGYLSNKVWPGDEFISVSNEGLLAKGISWMRYEGVFAQDLFVGCMSELYEQRDAHCFEETIAYTMGLNIDTELPTAKRIKAATRDNSMDINGLFWSLDFGYADPLPSINALVSEQEDVDPAPRFNELWASSNGWYYGGKSLLRDWHDLALTDPKAEDPPKLSPKYSNPKKLRLLVVSSMNDSITPLAHAYDAAHAMGASLIRVEGSQHGIASAFTNSCLNQSLVEYFLGSGVRSHTCSG